MRVWQVCEQLRRTVRRHFRDLRATHESSRARAAPDVVRDLARSSRRSSVRAWPLDPPSTTVRSRGRVAGDGSGTAASLAADSRPLPAPDVVHLHGLWRAHFAQAAGYARRAGVPVIVTVHGMLHPPALRQRALLKRLAALVFQDEVLRTARCLHATATREADEIRVARHSTGRLRSSRGAWTCLSCAGGSAVNGGRPDRPSRRAVSRPSASDQRARHAAARLGARIPAVSVVAARARGIRRRTLRRDADGAGRRTRLGDSLQFHRSGRWRRSASGC